MFRYWAILASSQQNVIKPSKLNSKFMLLLIPLLLLITAAILIIAGAVQAFSVDPVRRKKGKVNLLIGVVLGGLLIAGLIYVGTTFSRG